MTFRNAQENPVWTGRNRREALSGIFFAAVLCALLLLPARASADTLPQLSDKQFDNALVEMTDEYDKNVSPAQAERNPYINKRLIVNSSDPTLDPDDYGAVDAIQDQDGTYILQFDTCAKARRAEAKLAKDGATEYVEPDVQLFTASDTVTASSTTTWNVSMTGMDTYSAQVKSSNSSASAVVAVLDTGISFSHPLLSSRILSGKAKSYVSGYSANEDESSYKISHGTHVAGIIVQCTPNLNVQIMPVRVLDASGGGSLASVLYGIKYAVENGADVINMSIAGSAGAACESLEQYIQWAISKGVTVVVSAGNENVNITDNYVVPAYISDCIVVGAVDSKKSRGSYSNYGDTVDVAAPGTSIYSSYIKSDGSLTYANMTGTSMAAPHVSAMAAVLGMAYSSYTPTQIEALIQQSAVDLGTSGKDVYYGYGLAYVPQTTASSETQSTTTSTSNSQAEAQTEAQTETQTETTQTETTQTETTQTETTQTETTQTETTQTETTQTETTTSTNESGSSTSKTVTTKKSSSKKESITISKKPTKVKTKVKKNKIKVTWKNIKSTKATKKILSKIKNIQVQYATNSKFTKGVKTKKIGKNRTSITLKLKRKTTYYIRIRYIGSDGVSKWTSAKKVKTK